MSQLVSIDFSAALTTDFNGSTSSFSVSGGTLTATGEGGILTKTSLGTGDKWVRVQLPDIGSVTGGDVGIALGDSSGNCIAWIVDRLDTGNLWIEAATEYSTYTTWVSDTTLGVQCRIV